MTVVQDGMGRGPRISPDREPDSLAAACKRLWAEVMLTVLEDSWTAVERSGGRPDVIAEIRAKALRYFTSRDGREVLALAGITADPEHLADVAVDPDARERTIRREVSA